MYSLHRHINPASSHHAYLIEGEPEAIRADIFSFIEQGFSMPVVGNPDVVSYRYNSFSIDDARVLQQAHILQPTSYPRKIMVVMMNAISQPAQNALLKMFEEPSGHTIFFLVLPSVHILLPTLRSRLFHIPYEDKNRSSGSVFLKSIYAERLQIVKKMMDAISDEKKVRRDAIDLLESIISSYYKGIAMDKATTEQRKNMKELLRVRDFAYDTSASLKMLLEHITLLIPIQK